MIQRIVRSGLAVGAALILLGGAVEADAQSGQISGRVIDAETGGPLSTVQVFLQGTSRGGLSSPTGTFSLTDVPPGTYVLVANRIGYREGRQTNVTVGAGQTATVEIRMSPQVLALQEVVATGLIDPVEGVRSPITVARISREMMPVVVAGSAVQNLQGRVAGLSMTRPSGEPGSETTIQLRTPTSVVGSGAPLLVVDGVILGTSGTANIESYDIESIEVVKGAAAASLYGSQAAAGVIAITTNRGRGLDVGQTRFTAASEIGVSTPFTRAGLPIHHHFLVDNPINPTTYVDVNGNPVPRANRVPPPGSVAFMDKPYPGPVYDNLGTLFNPGNYNRQSFSVSSNSASTNLAVSVNRSHDAGPLVNNSGYTLNSGRINVDHRFRSTLSMGVSAYHSRDHRDEFESSFGNMLQMPVDLDLSRKDENGQFLRVPDENIPVENPLWRQLSRESDRWRDRSLGNAVVRWQPFNILTVSGSGSYDRQYSNERAYTAKGTPTSPTSDAVADGTLSYNTALVDRWNAEAQASIRRDLGPLNARTTLRSIFEGGSLESIDASASDFVVGGVPRINAARTRQSSSSYSEERSIGYLWDTALDYDGKYIGTVLLRRDGSSVFGPDNRWHNYYRVAGAWRLSEEPWFNLPNVDEFKLSYSRGTAGGRPGRSAQYETWNISTTTGRATKATLGNRDLRPEHTTEQDLSLEMILFNRYSAQVNYVWQRTTDQLNNADLPAWMGYSSQWTNGGTVSGNTIELSLEGRLVQRPQWSWTMNLVADRSQGKIEEWPYPCDASTAWRYRCAGVGIYEIWGQRMLTSLNDLDTHHTGRVGTLRSQFDVNDEGYVVWVGEGNSWRDGIAKNLWGTSTTIDGQIYLWGVPFVQKRDDGTNLRQKIGDADHVNLGWINTVRYQGLTLNAHWNAAIGGDVVNREFQDMTRDYRLPAMDQAGRADEVKKPLLYYLEGPYLGNVGNSYWVEDGSYVKLRTLSANYRLNPRQLSRVGLAALGMESMTLGFIGRNILSFTNYNGFDPEQALNLSTRVAAGSASYPSTRNYTAEIQVTF
jgi:TonB-linked SusC/RagA family outer membrane protein